MTQEEFEDKLTDLVFEYYKDWIARPNKNSGNSEYTDVVLDLNFIARDGVGTELNIVISVEDIGRQSFTDEMMQKTREMEEQAIRKLKED